MILMLSNQYLFEMDDPLLQTEFKWLILLTGKLKDFETAWYLQVGVPIMRMLSILMMIHLDIFMPIFSWFKRCLDRRCRLSAKKTDGGVHTK